MLRREIAQPISTVRGLLGCGAGGTAVGTAVGMAVGTAVGTTRVGAGAAVGCGAAGAAVGIAGTTVGVEGATVASGVSISLVGSATGVAVSTSGTTDAGAPATRGGAAACGAVAVGSCCTGVLVGGDGTKVGVAAADETWRLSEPPLPQPADPSSVAHSARPARARERAGREEKNGITPIQTRRAPVLFRVRQNYPCRVALSSDPRSQSFVAKVRYPPP